MRAIFLPFSKPSISEAEISAVAEVLRSGWITTGPNCTLFEEAFQGYCQAPGAVALSSATAGMHLALQALNICSGDEVITPSLTWVSTINLITLAGATPIFADIDKDSLMISTETVKPLITERTKLIIPVHFAGAALDLDPLRRLAAENSITLLEDAAHAAGTEYRGIRIGKGGNTIFSFHPIKNMTCGEGGMFCSDDNRLLDKIRRLKFHGLGVDAYDRNIQGRAPQAEVIEPGYKYNLTDIAAVIGLGQLARLDSFIEKRTLLAQRYLELLAEIDEISPLQQPEYPMRHAWHLFIIRLKNAKTASDRQDFMEALKRRNIGTGLHFKAVHEHKFYRKTLNLKPGLLPATEWNSQRICSLPLFPDMELSDVDDVVNAIKEVLA